MASQMIDLRHLKTLSALRNKDSLMAAAEAMYLTQSALSHQIKDLEERIGTTLFIRNTHPVRFTAAGLRLLRLADSVLPLVQEATLDLSTIAGGKTGRLLMAMECHSCFDWIIPVMESFRAKWPGVVMDLSTGFGFEPLSALARGDLDLVVTADPVATAKLAYQPLFRYEAVLVMPPQHPLAQKTYIEPEDLVQENLVAYPIERSRMDLFNLFLQGTAVSVGSIRTAELTPVIIQLVASGIGLACLPCWVIARHVERAVLAARPLGQHGCWNTLFAAWRNEQSNIAFMQDFLRIARQTCMEMLPGIAAADLAPGNAEETPR